jgi:hypothetical protein
MVLLKELLPVRASLALRQRDLQAYLPDQLLVEFRKVVFLPVRAFLVLHQQDLEAYLPDPLVGQAVGLRW